MTAATIALPSSTVAPRLVARTMAGAAAVVAAAVLTTVGLVMAPYIVLGLFVAVAVVLGMAEIGRTIDQTFETLIALGD